MIDLTPLDVRKKRGDFKKSMRGYEPQEVDIFIDLVAERMEELVKETIGLRERAERLQAQVDAQSSRERAIQDALVTAQELREEMREQSRREAEVARREAEVEVRKVLAEADRRVEERRAALEEMERKRARFLRAFRVLLERELDVVMVEEGRSPLDERPVELELSGGRSGPEEREGGGDGGGDGIGTQPAEPRGGSSPRSGEPKPGPASGPVSGKGPAAPGEFWLSGRGDPEGASRLED